MDILLIGSGHNPIKRISDEDGDIYFSDEDNITSIDMNPSCNPTHCLDLNDVFPNGKLPLGDESFDQIHAYNVLEHIGIQGDWKGYFDEFSEYHRILRNNGLFYIIVPIGRDLFADPGHKRFFDRNHFSFLCQGFYKKSMDLQSEATDYRWYWKKNFDIVFIDEIENHHLAVVLRKS